jgi:hypothetical protein
MVWEFGGCLCTKRDAIGLADKKGFISFLRDIGVTELAVSPATVALFRPNLRDNLMVQTSSIGMVTLKVNKLCLIHQYCVCFNNIIIINISEDGGPLIPLNTYPSTTPSQNTPKHRRSRGCIDSNNYYHYFESCRKITAQFLGPGEIYSVLPAAPKMEY